MLSLLGASFATKQSLFNEEIASQSAVTITGVLM
jgi:hypothetical protein